MRNEDKGCTKASPVGKLVFNKLVADQVYVDIDGKVVTMASVFAQVDTLKDTVRLANVTIAQHEETIRALREGDKYTGEDINRIIADAQLEGHRAGLKEGQQRVIAEINRREGLTDTARQLLGDDLAARRNDQIFQQIVGEIAETNEPARCRGYITVTSCDDGSVSATADVDFPAGNEDKVASVLASLSGLLPVSSVSTGSVQNYTMSIVPRGKDE